MKNYQISPGQIPHLVSVTADLFRTMNHEIQGAQVDKSKYMHFVADLLKDLVETAYPVEENSPVENVVTEKTYIDFMKLIGVPEYLIPDYEEWKIIIVQGVE